jgi:hypothetical protein
MKARTTIYDAPTGRTFHDTLASSVVLAAMLASALCGAFVVDAEATVAQEASHGQYVALEESRS